MTSPGAEAGTCLLLAGASDLAVEKGAPDLPPDCQRLEWPAPSVGALEDYARTWERVVIACSSFAELRTLLAVAPSLGRSRDVQLITEEPWVGRGGAISLSDPRLGPAVRASLEQLPAPARGVQLRVQLPAAVRVHAVLSTLLAASELGRRRLPLAGMRVGVEDGVDLAWVSGDSAARTVANAHHTWRSDNPHISPFDVVLGVGELDPNEQQHGGPARLLVSERVPPVDVITCNPHGFQRDQIHGVGRFVTDGRLRVVDDDDAVVVDLGRGQAPLSFRHLHPLRRLRSVDVSALGDVAPITAARLITQLAAAQVPISGDRLPLTVNRLVGAELSELLASPHARGHEACEGGPDERELHSLQLRRAALRDHATVGAWRRLLDGAGLRALGPRRPSVSVLLATRRLSYLDLALATVARQDFAAHGELELVLALHDLDVPAAELDRLLAPLRERGIAVQMLAASADLPLGTVLQHATRAASGAFLAKLDDDDWYGRHHLTDLVQASTWSGATVTGMLVEWVYLATSDRTLHRRVEASPERYVEWVAGGTILIRAEDLAAVGGWAPQPRGVDLHLLTAVRDAGGGIYRTTSQGYVLCRHSLGHTWEADEQKFLETATDVRPGWAPAPELNGDPLALRRYQRVRELTAREQLSEARRGGA